MNLNNDDDIYKTLKESLEQLPAPEASQEDWESFKQFSGLKEKKKKPFLWYIIPGSIALAMILIGTTLLVQTEKNSNTNAETSIGAGAGLVAEANPISAKKPKQASKQTEAKLKDGIIQAIEEKLTKEVKPTAYSKQANKVVTETAKEVEAKSISLQAEAVEAAIPSVVNNPIWLFPMKAQALKTNYLYAVPEKLTMGSNRKIKMPLQADWIGVWGIAMANNNNDLGFGTGIQVGKTFGKGWYVVTGIEYTQINQVKVKHWNHDFESYDLIKIDTNLRMDVSLTKIVMVMDSVFAYRTHAETVKHQSLISTRNIDIPIEIGYGFNLGKWSIGSSIGIFNRIKHTQTNTIEAYPLSKAELSSFNEKYSFELLSNIGVSMAYPLGKRLWVQATPNLLINPFERKISLTETRLRLGIKYYLN